MSDHPRFLTDTGLFPLGKALRMLGFDALYRGNLPLSEAVGRAVEERRIWVAAGADRLHLQYGIRYFLVESEEVLGQLQELDAAYGLKAQARPFTRCLKDNAELEEMSPEEARPRVPERVREGQEQFRRCPRCGRIYWPGSHLQRMRRKLEAMGW
ncbi:MAG: hypothetical protein C4524_09175 [Candidatus Zixiibacteriota bacterium]|nr:MAG: hypothetical protein C4524_09175 [candidate division Zixibacteria bacterium]